MIAEQGENSELENENDEGPPRITWGGPPK